MMHLSVGFILYKDLYVQEWRVRNFTRLLNAWFTIFVDCDM